MKLRLLFTAILVLALAAGTGQVLAHLNIYDIGREGTANIHIADVFESVTITGSIEKQSCNMPSDDARYDVSENAEKVKLTIHWMFDNKGSNNQRFTVGYKVEKDDGNGGWTQLSKSERKVDKTIAAHNNAKGDCITPEFDLTEATKFRVTVIYDIFRQKKEFKTRTFTVNPKTQA